MAKCKKKCEVFSRVVGYMRPVAQWNNGKKEEFKERVEFKETCCLSSKFATKDRPTHILEKLTL